MKKILLVLLIAVNISLVHAQDYDTIPPYQKDSLHLPAFTVLQIDSVYTNDKKIPENKPVVIIYFNPACGHCQRTANSFGQRMKDMRHYFFVWVTYNYDLSEIKNFSDSFRLQQFNNTIIGKLTDYSLPSYFKITQTPFIAVYDKKHHLIKTYQQSIEADTLIQLLKDQD